MDVEWFVAKYMPDLRRREPKNVGVVLQFGERALSLFQGERSDGVIDARRLKGDVESAANFKAWVDYWRHAAADGESSIPPSRATDNYFLEYGGKRVFGAEDTDAETFLETLYQTLVEAPVDPSRLSVAQLSDRV